MRISQKTPDYRELPYYKAGDKDVLGNYRPVAVLPLFSKVVEKLFYDRLLHFLNKNNIIYLPIWISGKNILRSML